MLCKELLVFASVIILLSASQVIVFDAEAIGAILDTDNDEISLGQDLTIRLAEPDANFDSRSIERIPLGVLLITTDKFDDEPLDKVLEKTGIRTTQKSLMETGFNTGIFEVTLENINERLVDRGDDIRIVYFDNTPSGGSSPIRIEKIVHVGTAKITLKFDKKEYAPFDTIEVTVVAQMLNVDRDKIDTLNTPIGGKVTITTSSGLKYYPAMFETGKNTGIFVGKIKLTSDLDSKQGDLVVKSGDRIKVTAVIIPGFEVSGSVIITTKLGNISFDRSSYRVGDTVNVSVVDRDENRDPDSIDTLQVKVWSSTDTDGITLILHELGSFSGTFEGKFTLGDRSNEMLQVSDSDIIFAKYHDITVPSTQVSAKGIFASTTVGPSVKADILISEPSLFDQNGTQVQSVKVGGLVVVQSSLTNSMEERHQFVYITYIKDVDGFTAQLAFVTGTLEPFQSLKVARSWVPDIPSKYTVEVLVWDSVLEPSMLSPIKKFTVMVEE